MKTKAFILSAIVLLSSVAFSQTEKGKWTVSGNTSLQILNSSNGDDNSTTVTLNPSAGYFVANNLAVGASLALTSQEGASSFSILPTAIYYFPTASQVKPYLQAGIGYGNVKVSGFSMGGLAIGGGAGIAYFINKNVSLDLGLQYLRNDYDGGILNTFGGVVGFSLFF